MRIGVSWMLFVGLSLARDEGWLTIAGESYVELERAPRAKHT